MKRKVAKGQLDEVGDHLAERFTDTFYNLLSKAMTDIDSGRIQVDNFNDLQRLYIIWKEIVDYRDIMDKGGAEGEGQLPELTSNETKALEQAGVEDNTEAIEDMSDEDIQKMALSLMEASNQNNVDEMNGVSNPFE